MFFSVTIIYTIAVISCGFDVSLHCTMQPSGLRSLVKRYPLTHSALWRTRKSSVPCRIQKECSSLVVVNQHMLAHDLGSKDADNAIIGWDGLPINFLGFANIVKGSPSQPACIYL